MPEKSSEVFAPSSPSKPNSDPSPMRATEPARRHKSSTKRLCCAAYSNNLSLMDFANTTLTEEGGAPVAVCCWRTEVAVEAERTAAAAIMEVAGEKMEDSLRASFCGGCCCLRAREEEGAPPPPVDRICASAAAFSSSIALCLARSASSSRRRRAASCACSCAMAPLTADSPTRRAAFSAATAAIVSSSAQRAATSSEASGAMAATNVPAKCNASRRHSSALPPTASMRGAFVEEEEGANALLWFEADVEGRVRCPLEGDRLEPARSPASVEDDEAFARIVADDAGARSPSSSPSSASSL